MALNETETTLTIFTYILKFKMLNINMNHSC